MNSCDFWPFLWRILNLYAFLRHGRASKSSDTSAPITDFAVVDADEAGTSAGATVAILLNFTGQRNEAVAATHGALLLLRLLADSATGRATNRKEICVRNDMSPDALYLTLVLIGHLRLKP